MKLGSFALVAILALFAITPVFAQTPTPEVRCIEFGDKGRDYTKKGNIEITEDKTPGTSKHQDYCVNADVLQEYACAGNALVADRINCGQRMGAGYKCLNGACVRENANVFERLIYNIFRVGR